MSSIHAIVTAYCACATCCGREGGLTFSGEKPVKGITIAAPRSVPIGTVVRVKLHVGWKTFIVQDRTARRFDGRWDVFVSTHKEAIKFGKIKTKIEIK